MTSHTDSPATPSPDGVPNHPGRRPPRLYVASPLTNLSDDRRSHLSHVIAAVKSAIADETETNRADGGTWPVSTHIPWDHTAPWADDGLSPGTIYERNLDHILGSDGLIVVSDDTGSAGIGQEIEWATRAGLPSLYLSRTGASRQVQGNPYVVDPRTYKDADDTHAYVSAWLRTNRLRIQDGPRRRADRDLLYADLTTRLKAAWTGDATNRTELALHLGLHPNAIEMILGTPARVALAPWQTVCELAAVLDVPPFGRRSLTVPESRGLLAAAESGGWDDIASERLRDHALARRLRDLEIPAQWTRLHDTVYGKNIIDQ